eukprot:gene3956-14035_t
MRYTARTAAFRLSLLLLALYLGPQTASAATSSNTRSSIRQLAKPSQEGPGTVLVSGATGRTGGLVYKSLKELGYNVRALVRNASKAKEVLDCGACDESAGIYVGDITDADCLDAPMEGVQSLVILTSSYPLKYPNGTWYFPAGGSLMDIDWGVPTTNVKAAIKADVQHVLLVSSMGTTTPDTFLDKLGDGHALFYKLNGEIDLMGSGLPLHCEPGWLLTMRVGESLLWGPQAGMEKTKGGLVCRADVAAVIVEAIKDPKSSQWLRFDLSNDSNKAATGDFKDLFAQARAWGR